MNRKCHNPWGLETYLLWNRTRVHCHWHGEHLLLGTIFRINWIRMTHRMFSLTIRVSQKTLHAWDGERQRAVGVGRATDFMSLNGKTLLDGWGLNTFIATVITAVITCSQSFHGCFIRHGSAFIPNLSPFCGRRNGDDLIKGQQSQSGIAVFVWNLLPDHVTSK